MKIPVSEINKPDFLIQCITRQLSNYFSIRSYEYKIS